jgi:NTE family protein
MWRLKPPVLALGGGGARGFAHLGVLDVLDDLGLKVCAMAGTSMGAVVGAMYLAYGSAATAIERWREAFAQDLVPPVSSVRRRLDDADKHEHPLVQVARKIKSQVVVAFASHRTTVLEDNDLVRAFDYLLPDVDLTELGCPMLAVATDLENGEVVWLDRGNLRTVLKASSAIPGILPAVTVNGRTLVDGAVVGEVPVRAAQSLGWPVIGIDASMDLPPLRKDDLVLDTMMRTQMMTARLLRERLLARTWAVIRPRVGDATWADWHRFDELVAEGRRAARHFLGIA